MKNTRVSTNRALIILALFPVLFLTACSEAEPESDAQIQAQTTDSVDTGRWYSAAQIASGAEVFSLNCAQCHGDDAQGMVSDWRQRLDDGSFPPPPLNGSAHAWHHPNSVLLQVINNGGVEFGGKMPPFATVIDESEKLAAIAFFQNFWSDETYAQWEQMGGTN
jgi:mono/diheme cytochrome c family protein